MFSYLFTVEIFKITGGPDGIQLTAASFLVTVEHAFHRNLSFFLKPDQFEQIPASAISGFKIKYLLNMSSQLHLPIFQLDFKEYLCLFSPALQLTEEVTENMKL